MDLISHSLHKSLKNIIFKNNPLLSEMIFNWNDIVGSNFCHYIYPKKIYMRNSDRKHVLHIGVVNPSLGTEIFYQKHLIIERINNFFGAKLIGEIKIK